MDIIKYLVEEKHCDPLCTNQFGAIPLHDAAVNGHLQTVQYFVKVCNCPVNIWNNNNQTPLELARVQGHTNVVQ